MYARVVEEARVELRALREDAWSRLGLAAVAIALALVATQARETLALPLFLGGLALAAAGLRSAWLRWDLVEMLAGEPDAYVIPEVRTRASREATIARRRSYAAIIRTHVSLEAARAAEPLGFATRTELERLAGDLLDERLELDPASAVLCFRMLAELGDPRAAPEEIRARAQRIRAGLTPRRSPT